MIRRWRFLVLALMASVAIAQVPPPPEAPAFSQAELDQMLAPIALYPDELLSQILMAATYPLEVVQAARWSRAHPGLRGEDAVRAAAGEPWDPSVKSLLAFPQILSMMDEKLDWTQRLGNAFLAQEQQVMATVQELRRRAYAAGNLASNQYVQVEDQAGTLVLVPAYPNVVYVPYYSPFVVYGVWWWPAYPPVYWPAWPGYVVVPGVSIVYTSAFRVTFSVGFFFGAFDWPHRHVVIVRPPLPIYHRPGGHPLPPPGVWRHDPGHRHGVPYRTEAVRREFAQVRPAPAPRQEYRGHTAPAPRPAPVPRAAPAPRAAPVPRTAPAPRAAPVPRAAPTPAPRAFEGIRAGGERTREFSARGQASMSHQGAPRTAAPRAAPRTATPRAAQPRTTAPRRSDGKGR